MARLDDPEENQEERDKIATVLEKALDLPEIESGLDRFQQQPPDLVAAVDERRADIWRRVMSERLRVREAEARLVDIERRIAGSGREPVRELATLGRDLVDRSQAWRAILPDVQRLRLNYFLWVRAGEVNDDAGGVFVPNKTALDPEGILGKLMEVSKELSKEFPYWDGLSPVDSGGNTAALSDAAVDPTEGAAPESPPAGRLAGRSSASRLVALLGDVLSRVLRRRRDEKQRVLDQLRRLGDETEQFLESIPSRIQAAKQSIMQAGSRDAEYVTTVAELEAARKALDAALLNDGILPTLRSVLNEALEDLYTLSMPIAKAPGLMAPLAFDKKPVMTPAILRTRDLLSRMNGVSVGVAGPRGAGKSTLIDAFCTGKVAPPDKPDGKPWLGVLVSAPVKYEPREFILYLFAELCRKVLATRSETGIAPELEPTDDNGPSQGASVAAAAIIGTLVAALGGWFVVLSLRSHPTLVSQVTFATGILVFVLAGSFALQRSSRTPIYRYIRQEYEGSPEGTPAPPLPWPGWLEPLRLSLLRWRVRFSRITRIPGMVLLIAAGGLAVSEAMLAPTRSTDYLIGCAAMGVSGLLFLGTTIQAKEADLAETRSPSLPPDVSLTLARLLPAAAWISLAFSLAAIYLAFVDSDWSLLLLSGLALVLLGGGTVCSALARASSSSRAREMGSSWDVSPTTDNTGVTDLALANLLGIQFQRTVSSDWSATLKLAGGKLPIGLESQWKRSASWAREPQGYPELVGRFRHFVEELILYYRVVIGIDELDKLEPAAEAEQFLNNIKGIFGIRECYFLVSVSEDAAASFERRGVPFRDVFDTCFDEIITASYLDYPSAKLVLFDRVIGWPMPFIGLCHVLSGGLARDLIRAARIVNKGDQNEDDNDKKNEEIGLTDAVARLCRAEAAAKVRGVRHELARQVSDDFADVLLGLLAGMDEDAVSADEYHARSDRLLNWAVSPTAQKSTVDGERNAGSEPSAYRHARELATFYLFLAAVLEFFGDTLTRERLETAESPTPDLRSLDHLAAGRQAMSMNPQVAAQYVSDFREAWGLGQAPKLVPASSP